MIQHTVYRFFNDALQSAELRESDISLPLAVYEYLGMLGYTQAHVSSRWKAYAEDAGYAYNGDLDIQNNVARGLVTLPDPE